MKNYFSYSDQDAAMIVRWVKEERNLLALLERDGYEAPQTFDDLLMIADEYNMQSEELDILVRVLYANRKASGYVEEEQPDGWYDWEGANNFANRHEED